MQRFEDGKVFFNATYDPIDPRGQADTLAVHSLSKSFHALDEEVDILMYSWLFCLERTSAKGRRKLFGDLAMSHGVPFPDETTMLIIAMIIDLGFRKPLKKLVMGTIQI